MNSLQFNIDNYRNIYETPYRKKCLINDRRFPKEMVREIFSYLGGCGLLVKLVCRKWNRELIEGERNDLKVLQQFVECCPVVLHQRLFNVVELRGSTTLVKMVKLRQDIDQTKLAIVASFKSLKDEDLKLLEEKTKDIVRATFLRNVFWLVRIFKKLDEVLELGMNVNRENHHYIYKILSETHSVSKGMEEHLEDGIGNVGGRLCELLLMEGDFIKPLTVGNKLAIGEGNWNSLKHFIITELITFGHLKKAMEVCSTISEDDEKRSKAYVEIAMAFIQRGGIDIALEIVKTLIPDEYHNSKALSVFIQKLIVLGEIERAYKVTPTISIPSIRNVAYKCIALDYILKGNVDGALEILNNRVTTIYRHHLFMAIIDKYMALDDIKNALEFSQTGFDDYDKGMGYGAIAVWYCKRKEHSNAYEIAKSKPKSDLAQVYAFSCISAYYLEARGFQKAEIVAIDIARIVMKIKDEKIFLEACDVKKKSFNNIMEALKNAGKLAEVLLFQLRNEDNL